MDRRKKIRRIVDFRKHVHDPDAKTNSLCVGSKILLSEAWSQFVPIHA